MIVCDFVDKNVEDFIEKDKSKRIVLTFFKEPFNNFKGNEVIFIDDILDDNDYKKIDDFVEKKVKIITDIFSKYLKIEGYNLFNYIYPLGIKRNLGKVYKYKYGIDKITSNKKSMYLNFFSTELVLFELIKRNYLVNIMSKNTRKMKLNIKSKIIRWVKNSHFINYIFNNITLKLFLDKQEKIGNILWLGGRLVDSKLIPELQKKNRIFLLQQGVYKFSFAMRKNKFDLLKIKNNEKFNKKWDYLKNQYEDELNKIAFITGINKKILEIILEINKNIIKDLLLTLIILEDNKNNIDLLIVEQSVIGIQALAVDFFNKNKLPSIEVLHGVPAVIQVGKTNKIAVYGQRDKLFLTNYGVDESKIKITGCPYYDRIFNIKDEEKKYDFLLLILDWIAFSPSSNSYKKIFTQIIDMIKLLQYFRNENLIIKLHPGQSEKEIEYISHLTNNFKEVRYRIKIKKNEDTINLLKDSKIVYTYCSSVGVEALLMRKPLIILDYIYSQQRPTDYEKYNGCLVAKNFKELRMSTEEILKDAVGYLEGNKENIEKTRKYFSGDLKGESYKNVAKLIKEMLSK